MKNAIVLLLIWFISISVYAVDGASIAKAPPSQSGYSQKSWYVEGAFQAVSVAGEGSPLFGPSISYQISKTNSLGIRTLMSISGSVDTGAYIGQALWRHRFSFEPTFLFSEFSLGANLVEKKGFASGGLAVGILSELTESIAFGGIAGAEMAKMDVSSSGVFSSRDFIIYPKVSIIGSFAF